jgi:hypothetical protein
VSWQKFETGPSKIKVRSIITSAMLGAMVFIPGFIPSTCISSDITLGQTHAGKIMNMMIL